MSGGNPIAVAILKAAGLDEANVTKVVLVSEAGHPERLIVWHFAHGIPSENVKISRLKVELQ